MSATVRCACALATLWQWCEGVALHNPPRGDHLKSAQHSQPHTGAAVRDPVPPVGQRQLNEHGLGSADRNASREVRLQQLESIGSAAAALERTTSTSESASGSGIMNPTFMERHCKNCGDCDIAGADDTSMSMNPGYHSEKECVNMCLKAKTCKFVCYNQEEGYCHTFTSCDFVSQDKKWVRVEKKHGLIAYILHVLRSWCLLWILLLGIFLFYWRRKRKEEKVQEPFVPPVPVSPPVRSTTARTLRTGQDADSGAFRSLGAMFSASPRRPAGGSPNRSAAGTQGLRGLDARRMIKHSTKSRLDLESEEQAEQERLGGSPVRGAERSVQEWCSENRLPQALATALEEQECHAVESLLNLKVEEVDDICRQQIAKLGPDVIGRFKAILIPSLRSPPT